MYVTSSPYIDIVVFVVYRLQNRRLRFCLHPPQNHPFLTTRIGIIEDGLLRICQVKPDRLIVVVSLYRVVCYLSIAGAFNVIPGRLVSKFKFNAILLRSVVFCFMFGQCFIFKKCYSGRVVKAMPCYLSAVQALGFTCAGSNPVCDALFFEVSFSFNFFLE